MDVLGVIEYVCKANYTGQITLRTYTVMHSQLFGLAFG